MFMEGQDRPVSSFLQFMMRIDLNLGGIPFSGKDSISGQFSSRKYSNFGRRMFISRGSDFNLLHLEMRKRFMLGAGNLLFDNDTKLGHSRILKSKIL